MKNLDKRIRKITGANVVIGNKTFNSYVTVDIYALDIINPVKTRKLHGHKIKNSSDRYVLFDRDEKTCVCCGVKASFWALQYAKNSKLTKPHLNLYGLSENNEITLFTKDHKLPRSMGGLDKIENYQIMCVKCNSKKDNDVNWKELNIETNNYKVEVGSMDKNEQLLRRGYFIIEANNENNARGIACKKARESTSGCKRSIVLNVALLI